MGKPHSKFQNSNKLSNYPSVNCESDNECYTNKCTLLEPSTDLHGEFH